MASMILSFGDIYGRVSDFLGTGTTPTGTALTTAQDIVHRGYRQFLNSVDLRTGRHHTWSFLKKEFILVTQNGVSEYELPKDFGYLWYGPRYDNEVNKPTPQVSTIETIRTLLSVDESNTYPQLFTIIADKYDPLFGQTYKIVFYPLPDSSYLMRMGYILEPPKLVNATDIFVGGTRSSEAILECCLAVAEQQEDDTAGLHTQLAAKLVNDLIRNDVQQTPDSLGVMGCGGLIDNYTAARLLRWYPDPTEIYGVS